MNRLRDFSAAGEFDNKRMSELRCDNITYGYSGDSLVLSEVSIALPEGRIYGLIGRSGIGKSTLLNVMAGYLGPSSGNVVFGERILSKPSWLVQPVYQEDSLWPWLTVAENVLIANRFKRGGRNKSSKSGEKFLRRDAVASLAEVGLGLDVLDKWPKELSIGMRKRVELARILLYKPTVILADEPFAALDVVAKQQLAEIIRNARNLHGVAVLFSSHDLDDVVTLCERVFVLGGSPATIINVIDNPYHGPGIEDENSELGRSQIKHRLQGALESTAM